MARTYDIEWKGAKIHCKSLEDAAALLKKLGEPQTAEVEPWAAREFTDFTSRIQRQQKKLLYFLKEDPDHTDETLRGALDLDSNQALAGILSGITKVAKAMDIDHTRVYRQRTRYEQGKPIRLYNLAPSFRTAAIEFDWPSKSEEDAILA
jgi:hypothetical protein